jgi:hypothetical protein
VKKLPLDDALKVYEAADDSERQKLFEVMRMKASNAAQKGGLNNERKQRLRSTGLMKGYKALPTNSMADQ